MSLAPARTLVGARAGAIPIQRSRTAAWPNVTARLLAFSVIAVTTHFATSLGGQVLLEQSRRESAASAQKLRAAQESAALLRSEVDALSNLGSLRQWATVNGFVASEPTAGPSKGWFRVAARLP